MAKEPTTITIRPDLKTRANEAVSEGKFPGVNSLSGLIERALELILNSKED